MRRFPTRRAVPLACALAIAASTAARAQTDSVRVPAGSAVVLTPAAGRGPAVGDSVRIVSRAGRYAGMLMRVTPDTFVVTAPGREDAVVRAEISEMTQLAWREPRRRAIVRGGAIGVVAGAVLGFVAGSAINRIHCTDPAEDASCTPGERDQTIRNALTGLGGVLGGLGGAMFGPTFRRVRWERVDPAPVAAP